MPFSFFFSFQELSVNFYVINSLMWSEYMWRRTTVKALSFELETLRVGHDLVLTELGQSWELDRSQILWYWAWQASHITPVLGRCHNVSKKINSEKQRLLTVHWVVQKQKPHKNDYFLSSVHNQPVFKEICRNFQPPVR